MTLNELIRNCGHFFWILNVAGWSGYVLTAYLGALAHEKPDSYIAVIVATAFLGFLLTIPMRLLYRRLWQRSPVAIEFSEFRTSINLQAECSLSCLTITVYFQLFSRHPPIGGDREELGHP